MKFKPSKIIFWGWLIALGAVLGLNQGVWATNSATGETVKNTYQIAKRESVLEQDETGQTAKQKVSEIIKSDEIDEALKNCQDKNSPLCKKGSEEDIQKKVANVINLVYLWVGIIAVAVIIYGGITYIMSAGSPEKVSQAKKIILYALIGLVITLLAFAITNFILRALEGAV